MTDGAPSRAWLITGAARGLGLALANAVLARGNRVFGTSRDGAVPPSLAGQSGLAMMAFDLSDGDPLVVRDAALTRFGRIDVLVNNAGYALIGPVEGVTDDAAADQFRVNFLGPLALIRAILPVMRAQRRGHIVNISSVAGGAPSAGSTLYAASKAALNALSIGLAMEVEPLGLRVTLIEPGAFRTDFLSGQSLRRSDGGIADYAATTGGFFDRLSALSGAQAGDPAKAAAVIHDLVESTDPPRRLVLGSDGLAFARAALEAQLAALADWEATSRSTDR